MASSDLTGRVTVDAVLQLAALDKCDWDRALQSILRVDSQTLSVDRTSYWSLHEDPRMIACELGYVRSADGFEQGATLLATEAGSYFDALTCARVVRVDDVTTDPRTQNLRDYCSARNIHAMLDVPVWVGSRLTGVLCHEHVGAPRAWGRVEIDFVLAVAQVIATALEARRRNQAEDSARREGLLANASLLMSRSLDERIVAERAVAAALPLLADWAAIDLFDRGGVERLAVGHADPQKRKPFAEYVAAYPPRADAPHLTVLAHRLNQSVLVSEITDQVLRNYNFSEEHIRMLHAIGVRSAMAVPVRVPDSVDAVMIFGSAVRRYDYSALKLVEQYGERVALALNNARLYRRANDALGARDEFLTLAAHELRTPLTSLRLSCERLDAAVARSREPDIAEIGERILRQSRRLSRLVDRMLDVSLAQRRSHLVGTKETDLVPLVREVVGEFASSKFGDTIALTLPASVVGRWDGDRLQEVVGNLIDNALKYGRGRPIAVTLAVEGDSAVLTVSDQGIGIDADVLPRLFSPYERGTSSKGYGGLGLGLFVSRQIVAAHGGTLDVRSESDVGSEFSVRLPGIISLEPELWTH